MQLRCWLIGISLCYYDNKCQISVLIYYYHDNCVNQCVIVTVTTTSINVLLLQQCQSMCYCGNDNSVHQCNIATTTTVSNRCITDATTTVPVCVLLLLRQQCKSMYKCYYDNSVDQCILATMTKCPSICYYYCCYHDSSVCVLFFVFAKRHPIRLLTCDMCVKVTVHLY